MSSISTIQNDGRGLLTQLLQRLSTNPGASPPLPPTGAPSGLATSPIGVQPLPPARAPSGLSTSPIGFDPQPAVGPRHHSHGGLFKKIEEAVTAALQSIQPGDGSDPNQIIENTIASVFSQSGSASKSSTLSKVADRLLRSGGDSGSTQSAAHQSFMEELKALGVSADQFRSDFLAAIKDAQGGQVDPAKAFKNVPPGVIVDATS